MNANRPRIQNNKKKSLCSAFGENRMKMTTNHDPRWTGIPNRNEKKKILFFKKKKYIDGEPSTAGKSQFK